jgi:DNA repair photolyase
MAAMNTIRKILNEEIKWLITLATIIISITLSYGAIVTKIAVVEQRLDTIENNHLVHIQNSIQRIDERVRSLEINQ